MVNVGDETEMSVIFSPVSTCPMSITVSSEAEARSLAS